jgi:hypothetical protein
MMSLLLIEEDQLLMDHHLMDIPLMDRIIMVLLHMDQAVFNL